MKKLIFSAIILVCAAAVYAQKPAPQADLKTAFINGASFRLSPYKDKPVLIVYMSTTCGACMQAVGFINELQAQYSSDITIIGAVFANEAQTRDFGARLSAKFPLAYNIGKIMDAVPIGATSVPTYVILDNKHAVSKRITGSYRREIKAEVEKVIAAARASAAPQRQVIIEGVPVANAG